MVSIPGASGSQRFETISKVAAFLGAPEEHVTQLLEEGRLGGALLHTLSHRGVVVTPSVKNAVGSLVRGVEANHRVPICSPPPDDQLHTDGTATIMFTDIVGSSSIMQRLGDHAGRVVISRHDETIRLQTAAHEGTEVKSIGDGFMLSFRSAHRGVACAVAMQRSLADSNSDHAETPIAIRIGLSVGEPVRDKKDLFGLSVIMAARITAAATGDQVLVSEITYALASSSGEFQFRPVGPVELKGLDGTFPLYEVVW